jgi:hypothetical protein
VYLFPHLHILFKSVVVELVMQPLVVPVVLEEIQYSTLLLHLGEVVAVQDHLQLEHLVDQAVEHLLMECNQHQMELEIQAHHQELQIKFLHQMDGVMMVEDRLPPLELQKVVVVVVPVELVKLEQPHHMHQELLDLVAPD